MPHLSEKINAFGGRQAAKSGNNSRSIQDAKESMHGEIAWDGLTELLTTFLLGNYSTNKQKINIFEWIQLRERYSFP